jgi:autotransporter-associated beta strand protein
MKTKLGVLAVLCSLVLSLSAQDRTWSGGATGSNLHQWSHGNNWTGGTGNSSPGNNNTAFFGSVTGNSSTPNFDAIGIQVGRIHFNSDAGAFTFSGNSVTINGVSGVGITNLSNSGQTFQNTITLGNAQSWGAIGAGGLTFGNIGLGAHTLTLGGDSAGGISIGGIISGGGGLVKSGAHTLTLGGNNTFTGGLTIQGGIVQLNHTGALNSTTPNAVSMSGGTLRLNGNSVTISSLSGTGGTVQNNAAGSATLTVNQATGPETFSGQMQNGDTGSLGFTKTGGGTLILNNTHSYTGPTTISGGVVQLAGGNDRLPTGTALTVNNPGSLDLNNQNQQVASLAGSGNIGLGTGKLTVSGSDNTTFSGAISGSGQFEKSGPGTLTLSGNNTYTGGTTLSGGTLTLGANNALPSGGNLILNGGTLVAGNFTQTIGALSLIDNSTIDLFGTPSLTIGSFGNITTGKMLNVLSWAGDDKGPFSSGGTAGTIFLTTFTAGDFLPFFHFDGHNPGAFVLNNGEVVPVPEPIHIALGVFGVVFVGVRFGRRFFAKDPQQPAPAV